jgi:orotate phosphoribosyltransferase-like protein
MTKYSDEFMLKIRSDDKHMTHNALAEKYKLSKNQIRYLIYQKKLTINKPTQKPQPKKSGFWEDFNALFRKIGF